ncbi:hypothetical protein OUZ56_003249 [Daphnia magna]|uniref:Uncharacterized protein n=1 Tax=Daphnia magna TaxID=35525 RepID=A0ABR0A868_9CRUS|nr:hypothetical protein OUZ56_003249 [Daphnia magna]
MEEDIKDNRFFPLILSMIAKVVMPLTGPLRSPAVMKECAITTIVACRADSVLVAEAQPKLVDWEKLLRLWCSYWTTR